MTRIQQDEALDWAMRVADRNFTGWDDFTDWLEAEAGNARRYDAAVAALSAADLAVSQVPLAAVTPPSETREPARAETRGGHRRWIGAAAAAAIVGAVGLNAWQESAQPYPVETAPGEQRMIALSDGSSVLLAGGTRVVLDRADRRRAIVDRGEALFRVRHDPGRPFRVHAGGISLTDIGTVFDVKRAGTLIRVAVSEGAVLVDPDGAAVRLNPGEGLTSEGDRLIQAKVAIADVGGWRDGRLAYDGASLDEVASDLSRQLGHPVRIVPAVARRRFQGTLDVASLREDPKSLGALLDVRIRVDAGGWTLEPAE